MMKEKGVVKEKGMVVMKEKGMVGEKRREKRMVTKMGPRMVMGRTKYRVGTVKAKVKERQRKLLGKSKACLKATEKNKKRRL